MKTLELTGYNLHLTQWVGRLGNHLIQLSNALHVAAKTHSALRIPEHALLNKRKFDFRKSESTPCGQNVESIFFWPHECFQYPILNDAVRRSFLQAFLADHFDGSNRSLLRTILQRRPAIQDGELLLNMRSGADIFRSDPPPQSDYMQPPLSFYKTIIEMHGYRKCVIVTEAPPNLNPVIPALLEWNDNIRLNVHRSVKEDINLVLAASHLVLAHSTFSWCLALMSRNLRVVHQPSTFTIRGVPDFSIHTYETKNYIMPGKWTAKPEQMRWMIKHPMESVSHRCEEPSSYLPASCMGQTNDVEQLEKIKQTTS